MAHDGMRAIELSTQEKEALKPLIFPLSDVVFKHVFGVKNKSENMLLNLVNAVLTNAGSPAITEINEIRTEVVGQGVGLNSYSGRMDILIETSDTYLDVESQMYPDDLLFDRAVYYMADLLHLSMQRGKKFQDMSKSICVLLSSKEVFKAPGIDFHSVHEIRERKTGMKMSDRFEMHVLDLCKFRRLTPNPDNPLHVWLAALDDPDSDFVRGGSRVNQDVNEYRDAYSKAISDPYVLVELNRRRLAEITENTKIARAEDRGEARGKAEGEAIGEVRGEAKGKREVAKNLLADGFPIAAIAKSTGLSVEEIKSLK